MKRVTPLALGAVLCAAVLPTVLPAVPATAAAPVKADSGARIVKQVRLDSRTIDLTVDTPNIKDEDPRIRLLVPKGWSPTAKRKWPVVYVFGGGPDDYTIWTKKTDIKAVSARNDAIVAMPASGDNAGFTDWYNGGKGGGPYWERFHTRDVVQLVERNFRGNGVRAAMGISSGASGLMNYATRNPGLYKYVAGFSGIMHVTRPGIPTLLLLSDQLAGANEGRDPLAKWGDPVFQRANWLAHDPYVNAAKLRGTGVYLSAGTTGLPGALDPSPAQIWEESLRDPAQFALIYGAGSSGEFLVGLTTRDLADRLTTLGIKATVHIYGDGLHRWEWWNREYRNAWPLIMRTLKA